MGLEAAFQPLPGEGRGAEKTPEKNLRQKDPDDAATVFRLGTVKFETSTNKLHKSDLQLFCRLLSAPGVADVGKVPLMHATDFVERFGPVVRCDPQLYGRGGGVEVCGLYM